MNATRQSKHFKNATGITEESGTMEQDSSVVVDANITDSDANDITNNVSNNPVTVASTSTAFVSNESSSSNISNGQSQLDKETNPMMNPVILKHLFDVSNAYQLTTYRQVCRLWYTVSMDRWRRVVAVRTTIRHRKPSEDDEGIAVRFDSRGRSRPVPKSELKSMSEDVTIDELLRYMNIPFFKLDIKPYKNYDMRGVQENDTVKKTDKRMMRFWSVYGPLMQELRFRGFKFDSIDTFRDIFCKFTPNLKKLNLQLNEVPGGIFDPNVAMEKQFNLKILSVNFFANLYREDTFVPLPWKPFLSMFPNLVELELSFLSNFAEFNGVLEAIDHIRKMNRDHLKLKKLDISRVKRDAMAEFPLTSARLLQELYLPLERLDVDIGYKTSVTSMSIILKSYHKTVKWLTLFRAPFSGPFLGFPFQIQFDSLKVLELYGPFVWDFSFLRFTPNLEKLYVFLDANFINYLPIFMRIYRRNLERKVDFLDDMVAATVERFDMSTVRLERLNTFLGEFEIKSPESIRTLAKWMPNIKHLGLHLGKHTFPTVCELYPELTCLCVYGHNDVDDEAITGVPVGVAPGSRTSSRIGRQLVPEIRPPNITNLTKLTSFTLSRPSNHPFECQHLTPKLTDHSVTHGILHLPQLRYLSLSMANFVSRKNFDALKKKLRQDCITLIVSKTCSCGR